MDIRSHNRDAWNALVDAGNRWTVPASSEDVERARQGRVEILLTPTKFVPTDWFPPLSGLATLCLASSGGQQVPLLAAAGCRVTAFDNSPRQLEQDCRVAEREGLEIETIEGDMRDLSALGDASFDLIVHPCANCFVPEIVPVWRECYRVLRSGGLLLAGFCNPVRYLFEDSRYDNGELKVQFGIPYSDAAEIDDPHLQQRILRDMDTFEFGHTLQDQIGGQLDAGFALVGFYEDRYEGPESDPISDYIDTFIATRALKR